MIVLSLFKGLIEIAPPKRRWQDIAQPIADREGVSLEHLCSKRDKHILAPARQEAWALIYAEGRLSYPQIGERFARRDHTTIIAGVRNHYGLLPRKRPTKLSSISCEPVD